MIVVVDKVANTRHQIEEDATSVTQDDIPVTAFMQEVTCVSAGMGHPRIMLVFEITSPADVDKYRPGAVYELKLEPYGH